MKYTFWILPPPPVYDQLSQVINELAKKYQTPTFIPHLTLVGSVPTDLETMKHVAQEITSNPTPLLLTLGPVSFSTTYFQSVFVRVNSTAQLLELNLKAKALLNEENNLFMPHISLLYGIDDMETREEIAKQLHFEPTQFNAGELVITTDSADPKEWQIVERYSLPTTPN